MTTIRVSAFLLLLSAALLGCSEAPPPSESYMLDGEDLQYSPSGPNFKLSREAARHKEFQTPVAAPAPELLEPQPTPPEPERKKSVIESLFQAVRHGAAEALDEGAAEN